MKNDRLPGIDALRILGALLVISLHIRAMPDWPPIAAVDLRLFARWVVPYFCIVLGYFAFGERAHADQFAKSLVRLATITASATCIYLVVALASFGVRHAALWLVSPRFFVEGAWFHLWFLNAALIGIVVVAALKMIGLFERSFWFVAAGLLIGMSTDLLFCWGKVDIETMEAARLFTGISLVIAGALLRKNARQLSLRGSFAILAVGSILTAIEGSMLLRFGAAALECQFPIGALVMGFGFFHLGNRPTNEQWVQTLAGWGRRYALGIYLLHPLFILALTKALSSIDVPRRLELLWPASATISVLVLLALSRYLPKAKRLLDGQVVLGPLGVTQIGAEGQDRDVHLRV